MEPFKRRNVNVNLFLPTHMQHSTIRALASGQGGSSQSYPPISQLQALGLGADDKSPLSRDVDGSDITEVVELKPAKLAVTSYSEDALQEAKWAYECEQESLLFTQDEIMAEERARQRIDVRALEDEHEEARLALLIANFERMIAERKVCQDLGLPPSVRRQRVAMIKAELEDQLEIRAREVRARYAMIITQLRNAQEVSMSALRAKQKLERDRLSARHEAAKTKAQADALRYQGYF